LVERRERKRVLLHCPIRLYRRNLGQCIEGETLDLSSSGFYCVVRKRFEPGENLDCILSIPAENFSANFSADSGNIILHSEVEVVRVHAMPEGFGVACRIDHYSLVTRSISS
jgi:hypothetical protein